MNIKLDSLWARLEEMDSWEIQCAIHIELWQWSKNIFTFAFALHISWLYTPLLNTSRLFLLIPKSQGKPLFKHMVYSDSDSLDNNHKRSRVV